MTGNIDAVTRSQSGAGYPASQQVSWFDTFTFAANIAAQHGLSLSLDHASLPLAGTPQWCGMADDDARKLMALILGGVREALYYDARQASMAEASREISQAADWSRISRPRSAVYIPREVA
jgi:hypothetical protein